MASSSDRKVDRVLKSAGADGLPSSGIVYYEGSWKSDVYPWLVAHGTVAAEVNYDTKSAKILLRYDGAFLRGTTKVLETKIDSKASGNAETFNTYVFVLKSADTDAQGSVVQKQNLEFTATSITSNAILGNYQSRNPQDKGKFTMHNISKQRFQEFAEQNTSCILM